jgi:flagellar hook-associated protein 1 FlgK
MAVGMMGTGVTGLLASQKALATTSQNIANVNTEGYSRQRVNLTTHEPSAYGTSFIGSGVKISSIERVYDQYLVDQVRTGTSSLNQLSQFHSLSSQIDNILDDPQAGLTPGLQRFFNAVQDVADDPTSAPARQVLVSEADTLSDSFHYLNQRIIDIERGVNSEISNVVQDINSLTSSIADINQHIGELRSTGSGEPNDILDQRDTLLQQLSEKISIKTIFQDDGSVNVFIGNGQVVVAGFESIDVSAVNNEFDPSRLNIAYDLGSVVVDITAQLSGGELGGLIQFRNEMTDQVKNSLGFLAVGLTETFNNQHRQGMDLNGNLGTDFFTDMTATTPVVLGSTYNSGVPAADVGAVISDVSALTGSDYTIRRTGATYTLTRDSDNVSTTLTTFPGGTETVDGIDFSLNSGVIADGDRFLVRPVRSGAIDISVAISDPAKIAAASPVRATASLANGGSAEISPGSIVDINLYDGDSYTMTFVTATTYEIRDSANNLELSGVYTSGSNMSFNGIEIAVSGATIAGDIFFITPNTNGISDNRNALGLAALQDNNTLKNNTVSYQSLYSQIVVDTGTKTRQAEINMGSQDGLLKQAVAAREAKSGVNLDEEAADLIKFQQLYQASAQVIAMADSVFQSLIDILRR